MTATRVPAEAQVIERVQETSNIVTLRLRFSDPAVHEAFEFAPGQFNMLYLYGVGEVPISIVSDPTDAHLFDHTIRAVGRVTRSMSTLGAGDRLGVRGPFGRGWPLDAARGRDVLIATGGIGCAPVVSVIHYVMRRRDQFGRVVIMQGVKHSADLIWRRQYEAWAREPDTQVLLAADEAGPAWPWSVGQITALLGDADLDPARTTAMMCGPEGMMIAVLEELRGRGMADDDIWLTMERNMKCAIGECGHCQFGPNFLCRQGPVFSAAEVGHLLGVKGL
ncbi:MAG: FAD/NAD(P)-binding protein [Pseudolabrys sp.]